VGVLGRYAGDWVGPVKWGATLVADRLAALLGGDVTVAPFPTAAAWGRSVGWLSLVVLVMVAARATWSAWNRAEMEKPPPFKYDRGTSYYLFPMTLALQLLAVGAAWNHGVLPPWFFFFALFAPMIVVLGNTVGLKVPAELALAKPPQPAIQSRVEKAAAFLNNLTRIAALVYGVPALLFALVGGTRSVIARALGVGDVSWPLAAVVALVASAALIVGLASVLTFVTRRRAGRSARRTAEPDAGV